MTNAFDYLLARAREEPQMQRLLLMFLAPRRTADGEEELEPVMVTDRPLDANLSFSEICRQVSEPWEFLLLGRLKRRDGSMPSAEEAEPHLQQMAMRVMEGGDMEAYLVFDRDGQRPGVSGAET